MKYRQVRTHIDAGGDDVLAVFALALALEVVSVVGLAAVVARVEGVATTVFRLVISQCSFVSGVSKGTMYLYYSLNCQTEVAAAVGEALVEVDLRVLVAVADVVDAVGAHGVLGGVEYLILLTVLAEKAGAERCDVDGGEDEGGGDEEGYEGRHGGAWGVHCS